jgi:hypothetical protein
MRRETAKPRVADDAVVCGFSAATCTSAPLSEVALPRRSPLSHPITDTNLVETLLTQIRAQHV